MFKQSPSRSQRSKGFKVKNALQIGLLLAVCIWLIYQVKHSHDKKKEFDESVAKLSEKMEREHNIVKFGRKDLHPRVVEGTSGNERHVEEEETPEEEDEEENKHEEEEEQQQEEENKAEEGDGGETRGGGDDENDEHDQERVEDEVKREGDPVDEEERDRQDNDNEEKEVEEKPGEEAEENDNGEKDNEETDEKDNEEKDNEVTDEKDNEEKDNDEAEEKLNDEIKREETEEKDNEEKEVEGKEREETEEKENEEENKKKEDQIEEQNRDRNTQEAREEHYKRDDASSAVVRDTQSLSSESNTGVLGNSNEEEHAENLRADELGMENKTNNVATSDRNSSNVQAGEGETIEVNSTMNATGVEGKDILTRMEDGSQDNSTTSAEYIDQHEVNTNSTAENTGTLNPSLQNGTEVTQDLTAVPVTSNGAGDSDHEPVLQEHPNTTSEMMRSENSTLSTTAENGDTSKGDSDDSSSNRATDLQKEHNAQAEEQTESLTTNENGEDDQNEKSMTTTETEDNTSDSTANDNVDSIETKPDDSTDDPLISQVNEAGIDLTTLPEIETGGTNSEEASAE